MIIVIGNNNLKEYIVHVKWKRKNGVQDKIGTEWKLTKFLKKLKSVTENWKLKLPKDKRDLASLFSFLFLSVGSSDGYINCNLPSLLLIILIN